MITNVRPYYEIGILNNDKNFKNFDSPGKYNNSNIVWTE